MLSALMSNEFVVIWMMVSLSLVDDNGDDGVHGHGWQKWEIGSGGGGYDGGFLWR